VTVIRRPRPLLERGLPGGGGGLVLIEGEDIWTDPPGGEAKATPLRGGGGGWLAPFTIGLVIYEIGFDTLGLGGLGGGCPPSTTFVDDGDEDNIGGFWGGREARLGGGSLGDGRPPLSGFWGGREARLGGGGLGGGRPPLSALADAEDSIGGLEGGTPPLIDADDSIGGFYGGREARFGGGGGGGMMG
jgi:hypothetical protein